MDIKFTTRGDIINTAVILAGGKSRRMGQDKLTLSIGGVTLLDSVVSKFSKVFENVYLSVSYEYMYPNVDAPRIVDVFRGVGPMAGLHSALSSLNVEGVFLVAADLPFASPVAATFLTELCGNKDASVIKNPNGTFEPLFAYYKRSLLCKCETALNSGDYKMTTLLPEGSTRFVSPNELGILWHENLITNINCPEDYESILDFRLATD